MLETLGLARNAERVYRTLLSRPPAEAEELTTALQLSGDAIGAALAELETVGLVHRADAGRWVPAPPDGAVDALIHRRQAELAAVRAMTASLVDEYRTGHLGDQPSELIEVVRGRNAIHQRAQEARRVVREELLSFDKPPYIAPDDFDEVREERVLLDRGIRVRAVYCVDALTRSPWHDRLHQVLRLCELGEQARSVASLPVKLTIYDRRCALVPLTIDERATDSMVIVRESGLLGALVALFESVWAVARTLDAQPTNGGKAAPAEREVLALLAAGATDDAIARQLGVSDRTVRRRVLAIMEALNASTRFEAGVAATRAGWL